MKKLLATFVIFTIICLQAASSFAENKMSSKLRRGTVNITSSPVEIPKTLCDHFKESKGFKEKTFGSLYALLQGLSKTAVRIGSGLWDISTAQYDNPKTDDAFIKPDYPWQKE